MASVTQTVNVKARRQASRTQWRSWMNSYSMLAPFLILFAIFVVWPILQSGYLSLTKYTLIKPPEFIGVQNYLDVLQDTRFQKAMANVVLFVLGSVALNTVLGLTLALVFRQQGRMNQVLRTLFFLPAVTSSVSTGAIWRWIFNGEDFGLANTVRHWLGLPSINWLSTAPLAVPIIILIAVWGGVGMSMIFFLAGLQGIPRELTEAAAIDGADGVRRLWYITIPLLRPTFIYVLITGIIGAFQTFDTSYIVFSTVENVGGPLDSALFPVLYLYYRAFGRFQMGYASAIAWIIFGIIVLFSLINLRVGRANESDQA